MQEVQLVGCGEAVEILLRNRAQADKKNKDVRCSDITDTGVANRKFLFAELVSCANPLSNFAVRNF